MRAVCVLCVLLPLVVASPWSNVNKDAGNTNAGPANVSAPASWNATAAGLPSGWSVSSVPPALLSSGDVVVALNTGSASLQVGVLSAATGVLQAASNALPAPTAAQYLFVDGRDVVFAVGTVNACNFTVSKLDFARATYATAVLPHCARSDSFTAALDPASGHVVFVTQELVVEVDPVSLAVASTFTFPGPAVVFSAVHAAPRGLLLVHASDGQTSQVVALSLPKQTALWATSQFFITAVAFRPAVNGADAAVLLAGMDAAGSVLRAVDPATGKVQQSVTLPNRDAVATRVVVDAASGATVVGVAWEPTPNSKQAATIAWDTSLRVRFNVTAPANFSANPVALPHVPAGGKALVVTAVAPLRSYTAKGKAAYQALTLASGATASVSPATLSTTWQVMAGGAVVALVPGSTDTEAPSCVSIPVVSP